MKALVFNIQLNSLYSIRIPFTWQSALTYPVLPPSAVIGVFANALQRYKNDKHPLDYLAEIETHVLWAGSRLSGPCVVKNYTTSAIVKWKDTLGGKFTNALGRQFAYSRQLQILAIFKDDSLVPDLISAIKTSPLTCGDSESPVSVNEINSRDVSIETTVSEIETLYPLPFTKETQILNGKGQFFLMHERCQKKDNNFPLKTYIVPIEERQRVLYPSVLKIKVTKEKVFKIEGMGYVVGEGSSEPSVDRYKKKMKKFRKK